MTGYALEPFIDQQQFETGDLVVFAGGPCSGRSHLLRRVALNAQRDFANAKSHFAQSEYATRREVVFCSFEDTRESWEKRISHCLEEGETNDITFIQGSGSPFFLNEALLKHCTHGSVLLLDSIDIGFRSRFRSLSEELRHFKLLALSLDMKIFVTAQLSRETWRQLELEGHVDPTMLPDWMMQPSDQVHLVRRVHNTVSTIIPVKHHGSLHEKE